MNVEKHNSLITNEIKRRDSIVGDMIIFATKTIVGCMGHVAKDGVIKARVIMNNNTKVIKFAYPNIMEVKSPIPDLMKPHGLKSGFTMRVDLLEGMPVDGSKVCSLRGAFIIRCNPSDHSMTLKMVPIQIPLSKELSNMEHCTILKK